MRDQNLATPKKVDKRKLDSLGSPSPDIVASFFDVFARIV